MASTTTTETKLKLEAPSLKSAGRWSGANLSAEEKEENLARLLMGLRPGNYVIVEHPGLDTPELRSIFHKGYANVARDRTGVTHAFTSSRVKQIVAERKIRLITYADLV